MRPVSLAASGDGSGLGGDLVEGGVVLDALGGEDGNAGGGDDDGAADAAAEGAAVDELGGGELGGAGGGAVGDAHGQLGRAQRPRGVEEVEVVGLEAEAGGVVVPGEVEAAGGL